MTLVPPIDRFPWCVEFALTRTGKLAILVLFTLGLRVFYSHAFLIAPIAALIALFPAQRRATLFAATVFWAFAFLWPSFDSRAVSLVAERSGIAIHLRVLQPLSLAAVLLFAAGLTYLAFRFSRSRLFRRPLILLFAFHLAGLSWLCYGPMPAVVRVWGWGFFCILAAYLWYLCYALSDRHAADRGPSTLQLGTFFPFWVDAAHSATPTGKGAAYLRKVAAKDSRTLAITQLKALKLLIWIMVLVAARTIFMAAVSNGVAPVLTAAHIRLPVSLNLPTYEATLAAHLAGHPFPWFLCWASLYASFFAAILSMASYGNLVVACARLAGFAVLRSTYKPLYATSLAEFWNRYYYYFKELLAEFFFFPVYLRYFKGRPRLRMFVATMAAAGLGNFLYHFLGENRLIADVGILRALVALRVWLLYCFLLGSAIAISQIRHHSRRRLTLTVWDRFRACAAVSSFYCVIQVFDTLDPRYTLGFCFAYLGNLIPKIR